MILQKNAFEAVGVEPNIKAIRGGTDGARLSYMGLPTPNIFAGGHNFHGKYEYVPLHSMQKSVQVILKIAELVGKKTVKIMYKTLLFVIGLTLVVQHSIGQQKSQKVIIDCDPGIDDAIALIVALESSQLEIIGITTVFGNVETSLATENAMRILDITGRNIPVFEGAKRPLYAKPLVPPDYVHGNDGLGNVDYPGSAKKT